MSLKTMNAFALLDSQIETEVPVWNIETPKRESKKDISQKPKKGKGKGKKQKSGPNNVSRPNKVSGPKKVFESKPIKDVYEPVVVPINTHVSNWSYLAYLRVYRDEKEAMWREEEAEFFDYLDPESDIELDQDTIYYSDSESSMYDSEEEESLYMGKHRKSTMYVY